MHSRGAARVTGNGRKVEVEVGYETVVLAGRKREQRAAVLVREGGVVSLAPLLDRGGFAHSRTSNLAEVSFPPNCVTRELCTPVHEKQTAVIPSVREGPRRAGGSVKNDRHCAP